jgi:hypothetical protein
LVVTFFAMAAMGRIPATVVAFAALLGAVAAWAPRLWERFVEHREETERRRYLDEVGTLRAEVAELRAAVQVLQGIGQMGALQSGLSMTTISDRWTWSPTEAMKVDVRSAPGFVKSAAVIGEEPHGEDDAEAQTQEEARSSPQPR